MTQYIPLEVLATRLNLPARYLRDLADEGKIPYLVTGKRRYFSQDTVASALDELARRQMAGGGGR